MCGISLVVQLLRLYASNAADVGSIPDYGTTFLHAMERGQKKKKKRKKKQNIKQNCNKFKTLKNGPHKNFF